MPERSPTPNCVIALDVGGTGLKGALLDPCLTPVTLTRRPTPQRGGPDAVVAAISDELRELRDQARERGLAARRAGVVVPGIVDQASGTAVRSANLGWSDLPLAQILGDVVGLPVAFGHDVRAGALAEGRIGAGRGVRDCLFVAVGTGIAAAVLRDGRPVPGSGYAGELGHLVVDPDGADCPCGSRGCLETLASASAIAAAYGRRTGRAVQGADRVAAGVAGADTAAVAVWEGAVRALATALAAYATLLAPERVVLGGGLAQAGDLLIQPLRRRLDQQLTFQRRPEIVRAEVGDLAGCLGAGIMAWDAEGVDVPASGTGRRTARTPAA